MSYNREQSGVERAQTTGMRMTSLFSLVWSNDHGDGDDMSSADLEQRVDPKMEPWIRLFVVLALLGVLILIVRIVTLPVERPPSYSPPQADTSRGARP